MKTRSNKEYGTLINEQCKYADKWIDYKPAYMTRKQKHIIMNHLKKSMYMMNKCNCCIRHSQNKVSFNDFKNGAHGEFPDKNTPIYFKLLCKCSCRQTSRFICRRLCELRDY